MGLECATKIIYFLWVLFIILALTLSCGWMIKAIYKLSKY